MPYALRANATQGRAKTAAQGAAAKRRQPALSEAELIEISRASQGVGKGKASTKEQFSALEKKYSD